MTKSSYRILHKSGVKKEKFEQLLTFQMNIYHEAMAALLLKSTFRDRYHNIVASAVWPKPCSYHREVSPDNISMW